METLSRFMFALATITASASHAEVIREIDLADPDQTLPSVVGVNNGDRIGWHGIESAGDFNGDGSTDLMIGSFYSGLGGRVWLFSNMAERINLFDEPIDTSQADLVIEASKNADSFGSELGSIGDINGDGCDDIAIAASGGDPLERNTAGYITVVYGCNSDTLAAGSLSTDQIDASNGFTIQGAQAGDRIGHGSIVRLGDFNADGFDDFAFGTIATNDRAGSVYVFYGQQGDFPAEVDLASTSLAFSRFDGHPDYGTQDMGLSVAALGDINGDGFDDFVTGAHASNHGQGTDMWYAGAAYIVFGEAIPPSQRSVDQLDGNNGVTILSGQKGSWLGYAVAGGRDINGDGLPDAAIGARQDSPEVGGVERSRAGSVFVIYGNEGSWPASITAHEISADNGIHIVGNAEAATGSSLAMTGTLENTGIADLVIGAYRDNPDNRETAGRVYVVKGQAEALPQMLDLSAPSNADIWTIDGGFEEAWLGVTVQTTPDLNDDDQPEILLGANLDSSSSSDKGIVHILAADAIDEPVIEFSLAVGIEGNGSVSSSPTGIDCDPDCQALFTQDTLVALSAVPENGSVFIGWAGESCGDNSLSQCTLLMDQDRNIQAVFDLDQYQVSTSVSGPGNIDPTSATVEHGQTTTLTLTPETNASIRSATGCGGNLDGTIYTTDAITADCLVEVVFNDPVSLNVDLGGNGQGSVSSSPGNINCAGNCSDAFIDGTSVTLSAVPETGSVFAGWAGEDCGDNSLSQCTLLMERDRNIQAVFDLDQYQVNTSVSGPGSVDPASATVAHGQTLSFALQAQLGAGVASASGCNGQLDGRQYSAGPVTGDCSITVVFEMLPAVIFADRFQ